MRITLLSAALVFSLHTCLAAVPVSQQLLQPAGLTANTPVKNPGHDKRKGTVGFISGLLLGPVGLGGVYLLTHNHAQRKAAKKGCVIFATVVVAAALCWLIVLGAKSGSGDWSGLNFSGGSTSPSGGSGRSGSVGGGSSGSGSHGSNSNWANNINFPGSGSSANSKKKPVRGPLPVDLPSTIIIMH